MPRAGTPLLVVVLFHELQRRTCVRERGKRSLEDEVGSAGPGVLAGRRTDMAGWIPEETWRLGKLWVQARLLEDLFFKGVADSLAEARTREEGKHWGSRLFFRRLPVLVAPVRVLSCQGDGEGGGRPSAVEGRKRPRRRSRATCGGRGHVAVAGGQACASNTGGICTFQ